MIDEQEYLKWAHKRRNVTSPCTHCRGLGVRLYSSGSTWRGGIGTACFAYDICDLCWGSGDIENKWTDLRKLRDKKAAWERDQVINYFASSIGATFDNTKQHMLLIADILDKEERKRKTPLGVNEFWWKSTLHMVSSALRKFGTTKKENENERAQS